MREKPWTGKCQRCKAETQLYGMSMFNLDIICFECNLKELHHLDYRKAIAVNKAEAKEGNTNFPGIGWKD